MFTDHIQDWLIQTHFDVFMSYSLFFEIFFLAIINIKTVFGLMFSLRIVDEPSVQFVVWLDNCSFSGTKVIV